jgi:tetratricopeptide (TPR) repeat protein
LAAKDASNLSWRRMLAQSTQTGADILMAANKPQDALPIYRQSIEIRRALFNQDKMNAVWQRDLGTTLYQTANCLKKLGGDDNLRQARECLQEAWSMAEDYHGADRDLVLDLLNKASRELETPAIPTTQGTPAGSATP